MKIIALEDVVIPSNRVRKEFNESNLNELAKDIQKPHGLLHPPVLRNDGKTLVSGERRVKAMQILNYQSLPFTHQGEEVMEGYMPYNTLADLSAYDLMDAELSENTARTDLSWQELVAATADLDDLRTIMNPQHTARETAAEILGVEDVREVPTHEITNVRDSLALSAHLDNPKIAKATTKREAMKVLNREMEKEFTEELAKRYKAGDDTGTHVLIQGQLEQEIPELIMQHKSFDLIIADPPYGIRADKVFGDMADLDHEYCDSPEVALEIYEHLAYLSFRVAKEEAHIYMFCDPLWFSTVHELLTKAGWWVASAPIIWDKGFVGLLPYPDHMPRRCYETIIFAIKGRKPAISVARDIIITPNLSNKLHAAQKPVELYAQLIRRSIRPGDTVLDPCCGSGTIFPAATRESVKAVGIEPEVEAHNIAFSRLKLDKD